jgi:hypothetical protein
MAMNRILPLTLALPLAACAPTAARQAAPAAASAPASAPRYSPVGLESVIGRTASVIQAQFGKPALDVREGSARKLQFVGPACILDAYLYPPAGGGEPIVTYLDARLHDGRDFDRASCVAALKAASR